MKKLLVFSMLLVSFVSYGQIKQPKYDGDYLYITLENGVGVDRSLKFSLDKKEYEKIKSSDLYNQWKKTTWSNPEDKGYVTEHKGWDEVIMYVESQITMSKFYVGFEIKNKNSLDFIDGSKGMVYLTDDKKISISYPLKASNGYGNSIIGKTIFLVELKDGDEKHKCYVYND